MKPKSSPKKRLVILYQMPESWLNVHSIWAAAHADPDWDVQVVVLPFIRKEQGWVLDRSKAHLKGLGVPYVVWNNFNFQLLADAAVLFTSPYEHTRPIEYRFEKVNALAKATAYVPYGLEVGGGDNNILFQYGQPVSQHASAVFVRDSNTRKMYAKHCPSGASHVVVTGLPRTDGFWNFSGFVVDPELRRQIGDRKAILWNAHFSFNEDAWSTFDFLGEGIFNAFQSRPGLALLFRPHPFLWKQLVDMGVLSMAGVQAFRRELMESGVIIDDRPDHRHAFSASVAMLSDAGSFLLEYLLTRKPVLYLKNLDGLGVNEIGRSLIPYYDMATDIEGVEEFLDRMIQDDDPRMLQRISAIEVFFPRFDGCAGQRALAHLGNLIC